MVKYIASGNRLLKKKGSFEKAEIDTSVGTRNLIWVMPT